MAKPQYVFPKAKRWPIGDKKKAEKAAEGLIAGRGRASDRVKVFKALEKYWGKNKEVRKRLDQYIREGPPPSRRAKPNPGMKKTKAKAKAKPKTKAKPKAKPKAKAKAKPKTKAKTNPPKTLAVLVDGKKRRVKKFTLLRKDIALRELGPRSWALVHTKSGLGLTEHRSAANARAAYARANKRTKMSAKCWNWSSWKGASKGQKKRVNEWIKGAKRG